MFVPHPIPYQGSKRGLAERIIARLPIDTARLIEPFAGSAAVTLAASRQRRVSRFLLNDANQPLMNLWSAIIEQPEDAALAYQQLWEEQAGQEREFYDEVRRQFNQSQQPEHLLYLLARCVKAAVRYNARGEFNQSPDNRRRGMQPATMRMNILGASLLLRGKAEVRAGDYRIALDEAQPDDVVYMDPPYQGVCGNRDPRYVNGFSHSEFVESLHELNRRQISFLVSYDGRTGENRYGELLPDALKLTRIELHAGKSSQATLLGRDEETYESLYLSSALLRRLEGENRPAPKPMFAGQSGAGAQQNALEVT